MASAPGESDLANLLEQLSPELLPQEYSFCTCDSDALSDFLHLAPVATFREREGLTLVVTRTAAAAAGLPCEQPMRCITLNVHSSLAAVGLTAAVAGALADVGISANVIAAYYHDHIFVPAERAEEALSTLQALAQ